MAAKWLTLTATKSLGPIIRLTVETIIVDLGGL